MSREFEWIEALAKRFGRSGPGLEVGIGSDCAVLSSPRGKALLTTDTLVQGVHFDLALMTWEDAGYRAVTTGLSDLAAGGADPDRPLLAFLSIAIPAAVGDEALSELADGFGQAFREFRVQLGGGDTVSTSGPMVINFAFIGHAERPMTRAGARPGDRILVAGALGGAAAALELLKQKAGEPGDKVLLKAYRRPKPLLALGHRLAGLGATACADVSDGLLADAGHIAEQSGLAVEIELSKMPIHPHLAGHREFNDDDRLRLGATSGDDYALVFTSPAGVVAEMQKAAGDLGLPCAPVGFCQEGPAGQVDAFLRGKKYAPERLGYEHG